MWNQESHCEPWLYPQIIHCHLLSTGTKLERILNMNQKESKIPLAVKQLWCTGARRNTGKKN